MKHLDAIAHYIALLKEYNERVNVYSRRSYDMLDFHVQDSVNLSRLISNKSVTVMDMGSGSGLPSVVLAISNPKNWVVAVESKGKKAAFLNHVGRELGLSNYEVVNMDVREFIAVRKPRPQVVTAKAFTSYAEIQKIIRPLVRPGLSLMIPISKAQCEALSEISGVTFDLTYSEDGFFYVREQY